MTTRVDYGDDNNGYEAHNPQQSKNVFPFQKSVILQALQNLDSQQLLSIEGQHIDRQSFFFIATALQLNGRPEEIKKSDLSAEASPFSESHTEFKAVLTEYQADEITEVQFNIETLIFGLSVIHQVGRLQAAAYGGKPPVFDPGLVPVFLAECWDNMREDQTMADYVWDSLATYVEDSSLYEPDELMQLRTVVPKEERKPMRRGTTKAFSQEELQRLRERRRAWTRDIENGSTQMYLADLLEGAKQFADLIVDTHFSELYAESVDKQETQEDAKERIKLTTYNFVSLGLCFGYWAYRHYKDTRELSDTYSIE